MIDVFLHSLTNLLHHCPVIFLFLLMLRSSISLQHGCLMHVVCFVGWKGSAEGNLYERIDPLEPATVTYDYAFSKNCGATKTGNAGLNSNGGAKANSMDNNSNQRGVSSVSHLILNWLDNEFLRNC